MAFSRTVIDCVIVIAPGDILAGKYAVERLLGKGGMGYVFAAQHTQLDQRVAIKVLTPELCDNPGAVARFLAEAKASVRIRGEHVVRVLDVGAGADDAPFMVMEFLDGHDLARELEVRGMLPIADAVDCVLQACEALAQAHALGIVHRDLKPANLFLTERPDGSRLVKVLDFGISKALSTEADGEAVPVTATQGLIGSPHYMSPEQIRTPRSVDTRSDIWSLGVILFQLLAGKCPFASETPMAILAAVVTDPPPDLQALRDDIPPRLQDVVVRCLEKDPRRRYRSVVELADDLQEYTPRGAEALARIAAIARGRRERTSSAPPPTLMRDDGPTLPSGSDPPPEPVREPPAPRARGPVGDARSGEGWGHSQHPTARTRRSLVLVGAAALVAVGALLWRARSASDGAPGGDVATSDFAAAPWSAATRDGTVPRDSAARDTAIGDIANGDIAARDTAAGKTAARDTAVRDGISARDTVSAPTSAHVASPRSSGAIASAPGADAGARTARARPATPNAALATPPSGPTPPGDPLEGRR